MGDIGEFVQGLNISPLWIFIPSTIIIYFALYRFYRYEVPKMLNTPQQCEYLEKRYLKCTDH